MCCRPAWEKRSQAKILGASSLNLLQHFWRNFRGKNAGGRLPSRQQVREKEENKHTSCMFDDLVIRTAQGTMYVRPYNGTRAK